MKKTKDGIQIPERCWYYLLDWKDSDKSQFVFDTFGCDNLCHLTSVQFWQLFRHATTHDIFNSAI